MFDTGVKEGEQLPPSKGKMNNEIIYQEPEEHSGEYTEEEEKRYKRNQAEMYADTGFTEKQGDITPAKWAYDVDTDVLPYLAKSPRSKGVKNTTNVEIQPYLDIIHSTPYYDEYIPEPPVPQSYTERMSALPALPEVGLEGFGKQDHYEAVARHLEGCGLLHLLEGGDHGKEGVSRINPPITVPASKVFTTKYEDDKIYVLPALPKSDPLLKALKEWMDDNELPINKSRANSGIGRSQTVGRVRQKFKSTFNESAFTKKHPDLKKLLHEIGKKYDPIGFTSIQVNQNYEAKPHIDKNNIGLSMIFAIGDYSGGDLYINDKKHNIAYHPLIFNGANNLHYVSKITQGDRYSFVFFKTGRKGAK